MISITHNINASPRKIKCKITIGNTTITNVKQLTYSSDWSGDISIGQAVSSYFTAEIPTPQFNISDAAVSLHMSVGTPDEWAKIGQFTVTKDSIRTKQGITSFTAYDKLYSAINTYYANVDFPASLQAICDDVCAQIGITSVNLGISYTVDEDILSGYTLRDVLGFIAAVCGKNAYISPNNALDLRWFDAVNYTADGTRANIPYIGESNCIVNRLICQSAEGVISSGSGQGMYFTCPIMTQDRLDELQDELSGLTYRKADVDIPYGNFCLQSGDIITVSTTGSNLTVPIMSNSWTYDGGLSSAVSAYGVSDYSGTANNAEHSVSAQRVQSILNAYRAVNREKTVKTTLEGEITHATEVITGATGGVIRINMGGDGKPAEFLILDTGDISTAVRVFRLNQNGLGFSSNGYNGPFATAITYDGHVVADVIAGNKISGVTFESTSGDSQIQVKDGSIAINYVGGVTPIQVAKMFYRERYSVDSSYCFGIDIKEDDGQFSLGSGGNAEFFYYSGIFPSGGQKFNFFGNVRIEGDLYFSGSSVKAKLQDLEERIEALEAQL